MAAEVAGEWDIEEIDTAALTVAQFRDIKRGLAIRGMSATGGRAVIINQSHGLKRDVIRQLLVSLERIPSHVVWIFTTTNENEDALFDDCLDASPLLSRCIRFDLARRDLAKPFAERAKAIVEREGLDGKPIEAYVRLIRSIGRIYGGALQEIESATVPRAFRDRVSNRPAATIP